jgi:hypothetical protein
MICAKQSKSRCEGNISLYALFPRANIRDSVAGYVTRWMTLCPLDVRVRLPLQVGLDACHLTGCCHLPCRGGNPGTGNVERCDQLAVGRSGGTHKPEMGMILRTSMLAMVFRRGCVTLMQGCPLRARQTLTLNNLARFLFTLVR